MTAVPTREDRFTFGLWTVGWQARDPFGDPTRAPLDPVEAVHRLAELGAYGVTFHDNDLFAVRRDARRAGRADRRVPQGAWPRPAWSCRWSPPTSSPTRCSRTAAFTANEREVRRFALRKVMRNLDLAAELGAHDLRVLGRP